ncbi:hypothetical protein KY290_017231 [Solanum tuberosum]|uniref:Uncharacterized protein n=1 Tax=Solanum tuberosum TaxID=4113 RepID=A0ABQ7VBL7_SOLTU|nr:hypothetical protein KY284_016258 [Solanum tuberosum]KAH0701989.1 hypothetical protein KY285_016267 [Solanum tuberosum]KAH0761158.1 hypothetical protein KY290_017231 [Solanum tuberosum]
MGNWSNASFTILLKLLKEELLPDGANLPNSYYEAKKIIQELGLSYNKIDACTNDCMLYWKEDSLLNSCKAKSTWNATNRAKLKILHHIGSKPIREIIYEKGGKDGNPSDLAPIFFETSKKDNKFVEPEAIEKHAQLEEMVQADPSRPTTEIVEKYCGPQTRSHVFGFWGGVKAKDLKGGTSSKAELLSALRSTRKDIKSLNEENKSLNKE